MTSLQKLGLYFFCVPDGIAIGVFFAAFVDKMSDALRTYRATGNKDEAIGLPLAFLVVSFGLAGFACFFASCILSL